MSHPKGASLDWKVVDRSPYLSSGITRKPPTGPWDLCAEIRSLRSCLISRSGMLVVESWSDRRNTPKPEAVNSQLAEDNREVMDV